ncbi:SGNH/GDSL hydrolase family protein [soil metagenome]
MNQTFEDRPPVLRRWWRVPAALLLLVVTGIGLHFLRVGADGAPAEPADVSQPAVLFIGDSYTEGPSTPDLSYGCIAAATLGWSCDIAAQPGTGYVNGGPGNRLELGEYIGPSTSFVERLPRLRNLYPADIVVLDGGRNDVQLAMNEVMQAFSDTLTQVIESWPNSRIVVIAPWFANELVLRPPALAGRTIGEEFRSVLRASPGFGDVDLIDPAALGWFAGEDMAEYVSNDGIHPNLKGVERIALLLSDALTSDAVASPS